MSREQERAKRREKMTEGQRLAQKRRAAKVGRKKHGPTLPVPESWAPKRTWL
jgi:hypothetical protein